MVTTNRSNWYLEGRIEGIRSNHFFFKCRVSNWNELFLRTFRVVVDFEKRTFFTQIWRCLRLISNFRKIIKQPYLGLKLNFFFFVEKEFGFFEKRPNGAFWLTCLGDEDLGFLFNNTLSLILRVSRKKFFFDTVNRVQFKRHREITLSCTRSGRPIINQYFHDSIDRRVGDVKRFVTGRDLTYRDRYLLRGVNFRLVGLVSGGSGAGKFNLYLGRLKKLV